MNGLVYRMPLVCLVGMGLVGCSAAGETPGPRGGTAPSAASEVSEQDPLQLGNQLPNPGIMSGPKTDDTDADDTGGADDADADDTDSTRCDCAEVPPGVTVDIVGTEITIVVDLPLDGAITVTLPDGRCETSGDGISIEGDVMIDVGTGAAISLVDASLDLFVGAATPILSGTANVPGSLLDDIGCGCSESLLPVAVVLRNDAGLGGAADLALELALPTGDARVDTSSLPFGVDVVALANADVALTTDGAHERLEVVGTVTANANLWTNDLPLTAHGDLDVLVTLRDRALSSVQVMGDLELEGDELQSGLTPLRSVTMPSAWLTLDQLGAQAHAITTASAHPLFSVEARALVEARFTPTTWSVLVCADVMTDLVSASVRLGQCVDSTPDGSVICECRRDDDGHCDGDDRPSEY